VWQGTASFESHHPSDPSFPILPPAQVLIGDDKDELLPLNLAEQGVSAFFPTPTVPTVVVGQKRAQHLHSLSRSQQPLSLLSHSTSVQRLA
jgi:hypothetical protein